MILNPILTFVLRKALLQAEYSINQEEIMKAMRKFYHHFSPHKWEDFHVAPLHQLKKLLEKTTNKKNPHKIEREKGEKLLEEILNDFKNDKIYFFDKNKKETYDLQIADPSTQLEMIKAFVEQEFSKYGRKELKFHTDDFFEKHKKKDFHQILPLESILVLEKKGYCKINEMEYVAVTEFPYSFIVSMEKLDNEKNEYKQFFQEKHRGHKDCFSFGKGKYHYCSNENTLFHLTNKNHPVLMPDTTQGTILTTLGKIREGKVLKDIASSKSPGTKHNAISRIRTWAKDKGIITLDKNGKYFLEE